MRLATRILRPVLGVKISSSFFCTHSERVQLIKNTFKEHREYLSDRQQCVKHFTDEYLYKLIEQNYCFSDIVEICNSLIQNSSNGGSDKQVLFIAYAYNLYYSQLKGGAEILNSITSNLLAKIAEKSFIFETFELQKYYLTNIKALTNRDNRQLEKQLAILKNTFFKFICLKYDIINELGQYKPITEKTLSNLMALAPFLPRQSQESTFLTELQKHYLLLLKYECNRILKPDQEITKNFQKETITRFILLMELGVTIGKIKDKFINVFNSLPTSFSTQRNFIIYLKVIKEFFTYQLINRIDYKQFDVYHEQLSRRNQTFKSAQSIKAFEQYIESLIVLRINNLKVFNAYFYPQNEQKNTYKGRIQK